jgi:hypothetical protein
MSDGGSAAKSGTAKTTKRIIDRLRADMMLSPIGRASSVSWGSSGWFLRDDDTRRVGSVPAEEKVT